MNYTEFTTISSLYADYNNYAKEQESQGKKPVSALKYALGNL